MKSSIQLLCSLMVVCLAFFSSCGPSNTEILSQARTTEVTLMRYLPTGMMSWISSEAADVASGRLDEDAVREAARGHVSVDDPDGYGADALTFFVMMEAVRVLDKKAVEDRRQKDGIQLAGTRIDALTGMIDKDLSGNADKDDSDPCTCADYKVGLSDLATAFEQSKTWMTVTVRDPADVGDVKALRKDLEHMRSTMGELSELNALRLQAQMDRSSKLMEIISSLLKKVSDTKSSILQNLK